MNPPKGSEFNDRPASPTDPQVSYLAVKNINGNWISIMANYSTHYVADIPENTISADYFGELHNRLQNKLGADENFVGIMTNGTSGDVNTFDFKLEKNYPAEPFQKTNLIANDIADSIVHTIKSIKWQTNPLFKFGYKEVKAAGRPIPAELLARCKKLVVGTDFNSISSIDKASDAVARLSALCVVELDEYKKPYLNIPLQAIRIGEGIIGTLPGEFFSETGLKLKKQKSAKYYFTVGLANSYIGYVPPAEQFKLGGYETWYCSSRLEINAERKIVDALRLLIDVVK